ncbi:DUF1972 domain-containing protein [Erythrobacter sp. YT30]|uniref:DUF1972 domain-containing protein n=1 Tax=Erythrobacter sp. YT30 TaxID=1735012 RepID=UPI00076C7AA3|nr:DUF1972 domain-containing protein [Erythrobacter sp. YT30]KWV91369.1 glycosyl transferase [Erythrobacter sp. YT30]
MKVAVLGTVGVPSAYGGFETLAENLVVFHDEHETGLELTVYCSANSFETRPPSYRSAKLQYIHLDANGVQSIFYDAVSLIDAVLRGHRRILLLGVSGAIALPLIRVVPGIRIITNVDGIEWKRAKWNKLAKQYLRLAERIAVWASHVVIADNQGIACYLDRAYRCEAKFIPYGGDHTNAPKSPDTQFEYLPREFALSLCRIEPENNINLILEAFTTSEMPLVFVGNWDRSEYGRELKKRYSEYPNIEILDPIYDQDSLHSLRRRAKMYVHGHSAGGTNPALVEMMHYAIPVLAFDCEFNRYTTENRALFFEDVHQLRTIVEGLTSQDASQVGTDMVKIAKRAYTWKAVASEYFSILKS